MEGRLKKGFGVLCVCVIIGVLGFMGYGYVDSLKQRIVSLEDDVMMLQASFVGGKTYMWGARLIADGAAGSGSMDDIPDANITDEDGCVVIDHAKKLALFYTWEDGSAATGDDFNVVTPDDSGGNGRWKLTSPVVGLDAAADTYANEGWSGIVIVGRNAGEAVDQGNPVYWDATDSEWKEADANVAGKFPARGIALDTGSDGNPLRVLVQGIMRHDDWNWGTIGGTIYLSEDPSDNAGLTQTAPSDTDDCVQGVGFALSDDEVYFDFPICYFQAE